MSQKIKVLSLFSGIGAFEKALERQGIGYELVGFSEIDKFAIESYCAIHSVDKVKNLGDVSMIDLDKLSNVDVDLVSYGFPCQDISVAGLKKGINEGTRSGLLYDAEKIIQYTNPKYAIAENVKNLVGKKFKGDFEELLQRLDGYGYNNYWKVLNTRDFGIPQNRERVFIVSIRKDIDKGFEFPVGVNSTSQLKSILEPNVDEEYHLSKPEQIEKINNTVEFTKNYAQYDLSGKGHKSQDQRAFYQGGFHGTLPSRGASSKCKVILEPDAELPILHNIYGGFNETKPRIFSEYSPTIRTSSGGGHTPSVCTTDENRIEKEISGYQIRKLTPRECWRLQGFDDEDVDKCIELGISNTQLYKQAGNSITVSVLEEIFNNLFKQLTR